MRGDVTKEKICWTQAYSDEVDRATNRRGSRLAGLSAGATAVVAALLYLMGNEFCSVLSAVVSAVLMACTLARTASTPLSALNLSAGEVEALRSRVATRPEMERLYRATSLLGGRETALLAAISTQLVTNTGLDAFRCLYLTALAERAAVSRFGCHAPAHPPMG